MTIKIHLEDGKGRMEMVYADGSESYDAVCELEELEGFGTLVYFMLIDPATGEKDGSGMVLALYNDGSLVWLELDEDDNDIFYCFVRVEEQTAE